VISLPPGPPPDAVVEALDDVETGHPYPADAYHRWSIARPGASTIALHFVTFDLEPCFAAVTVTSLAGEVLDVIDASRGAGAFWTQPFNTDELLVEFETTNPDCDAGTPTDPACIPSTCNGFAYDGLKIDALAVQVETQQQPTWETPTRFVTHLLHDVQTTHPYPGGVVERFDITFPEALGIQLHVATFALEPCYAAVKIGYLDGDSFVLLDHLTGDQSAASFWTPEYAHPALTLEFTSLEPQCTASPEFGCAQPPLCDANGPAGFVVDMARVRVANAGDSDNGRIEAIPMAPKTTGSPLPFTAQASFVVRREWAAQLRLHLGRMDFEACDAEVTLSNRDGQSLTALDTTLARTAFWTDWLDTEEVWVDVTSRAKSCLPPIGARLREFRDTMLHACKDVAKGARAELLCRTAVAWALPDRLREVFTFARCDALQTRLTHSTGNPILAESIAQRCRARLETWCADQASACTGLSIDGAEARFALLPAGSAIPDATRLKIEATDPLGFYIEGDTTLADGTLAHGPLQSLTMVPRGADISGAPKDAMDLFVPTPLGPCSPNDEVVRQLSEQTCSAHLMRTRSATGSPRGRCRVTWTASDGTVHRNIEVDGCDLLMRDAAITDLGLIRNLPAQPLSKLCRYTDHLLRPGLLAERCTMPRRLGLADDDGDGLSNFAEQCWTETCLRDEDCTPADAPRARPTSSGREARDTDGDGWWDGWEACGRGAIQPDWFAGPRTRDVVVIGQVQENGRIEQNLQQLHASIEPFETRLRDDPEPTGLAVLLETHDPRTPVGTYDVPRRTRWAYRRDNTVGAACECHLQVQTCDGQRDPLIDPHAGLTGSTVEFVPCEPSAAEADGLCEADRDKGANPGPTDKGCSIEPIPLRYGLRTAGIGQDCRCLERRGEVIPCRTDRTPADPLYDVVTTVETGACGDTTVCASRLHQLQVEIDNFCATQPDVCDDPDPNAWADWDHTDFLLADTDRRQCGLGRFDDQLELFAGLNADPDLHHLAYRFILDASDLHARALARSHGDLGIQFYGPTDDFRRTFPHELGHQLGLSHASSVYPTAPTSLINGGARSRDAIYDSVMTYDWGRRVEADLLPHYSDGSRGELADEADVEELNYPNNSTEPDWLDTFYNQHPCPDLFRPGDTCDCWQCPPYDRRTLRLPQTPQNADCRNDEFVCPDGYACATTSPNKPNFNPQDDEIIFRAGWCNRTTPHRDWNGDGIETETLGWIDQGPIFSTPITGVGWNTDGDCIYNHTQAFWMIHSSGECSRTDPLVDRPDYNTYIPYDICRNNGSGLRFGLTPWAYSGHAMEV